MASLAVRPQSALVLFCGLVGFGVGHAFAVEPNCGKDSHGIPNAPPAHAHDQQSAASQDARIDEILDQWSCSSAVIRTFELPFKRWVYEQEPKLERRAIGRLIYAAPRNWGYRLYRTDASLRRTSRERSTKRNVSRVSMDKAERWIWDENLVTHIYDEEKTYESIEVPQNSRSDIDSMRRVWHSAVSDFFIPLSVDSPIGPPVLLVSSASRVEYDFRLVQESKQEIWLDLLPRAHTNAAWNWRKITVILAVPEYLPRAVRCVSAAGHRETVHVFDLSEKRVNSVAERSVAAQLVPNLAEFKQIGVLAEHSPKSEEGKRD